MPKSSWFVTALHELWLLVITFDEIHSSILDHLILNLLLRFDFQVYEYILLKS